MRLIATRTYTYHTDYTAYYVDIVLNNGYWDVWLYNINYGVKSFCFGLEAKEEEEYDSLDFYIPCTRVMEKIKKNLPEEIRIYKEQYEDHEE